MVRARRRIRRHEMSECPFLILLAEWDFDIKIEG